MENYIKSNTNPSFSCLLTVDDEIDEIKVENYSKSNTNPSFSWTVAHEISDILRGCVVTFCGLAIGIVALTVIIMSPLLFISFICGIVFSVGPFDAMIEFWRLGSELVQWLK